MMDRNDGIFAQFNNQQELVDSKAQQVKKFAFFMKKALDSNDLKDALKYSSDMLGELRASDLEPVYYYKLYMEVFNELSHLEMYFATQKTHTLKELYDLVQHAGNVLPRLYLMCTVGKVYIKQGGGRPTEILKDLVEMCKGVQHPTRGLFLRSYLCQQFRGLLPEGKHGDEEKINNGTVLDSIDFLMVNFTEMNKLWVRVQMQGGYRDREKREKERAQLQDLVGKNLTYLSQLHGVDLEMYTSMVLPKIQEQIISCKDDLAQQYLMQCVIQGFPDEFHLDTLDTLLSTLPQLQPGVKIHTAMSGLMDRLSEYAAKDEKAMSTFTAADAFQKLRKVALEVVATSDPRQLSAVDAIDIYIALLNFTGNVHPDNLDYTNQLLKGCFDGLNGRSDLNDRQTERKLMNLLQVPIEKLDVVAVLGLSEFPKLVNLLPIERRKDIAEKIVQAQLKHQTELDTVEHVTMLFKFINPLVVGSTDGMDKLDIQEEQTMLARVVHLVHSKDTAVYFEMLQLIFTELKKGGAQKWEFTMLPLVFGGMKLVRQMSEAKESDQATYEKVLRFLEGIVDLLRDILPVMSLRLYISLAHVASNEAKHQNYAAAFFEQAFELYEENVSDSQTQLVALYSILGGLVDCYAFDEDARNMLVQKAKTYCTTLLKKADQCRAVCASAHLFWQPTYPTQEFQAVQEESGVVAQLKRGIKIANSLEQQMQLVSRAGSTSPMILFVEILNRYLYFFSQEPSPLQVDAVQNLLDLVKAEMSRTKEKDEDIRKLYKDTIDHIKSVQLQTDSMGKKFAKLNCEEQTEA